MERIRDQLRRAHSGDAWHGPSLTELLEDVDADTASARPIAAAHSIRELVLHIVAWQKEATRRVNGAICLRRKTGLMAWMRGRRS